MMSIHNSKGLDFPIVFVPLTDYEIRHSGYTPTQIIHNWAADSTGLKVNGIPEANYLKLKYEMATETEDTELEEEERRVLYVAATRAKKEIFFTCLENGGGKEILKFLQNKFPFLQPVEVSSSSGLNQVPKRRGTYHSLQTIRDQWQKSMEKANETGVLVDSVTREAEKLEPGEAELAVIAARAKQSGGTLVGLLCHGALEKWDFKTGSDLESLLRLETGKYARNFSKTQIEKAFQVSQDILDRFLRSGAAEWLRNVEIIGREVPAVLFDHAAGKILSGKIDLLVQEGNTRCIVDYKTDQEITEPALRRYTAQMRLYSQTLSGPDPVSCKLVLVRTGEILQLW
jgi:ATP-dependent exoDNAse (exonuclease V) beta subunit